MNRKKTVITKGEVYLIRGVRRSGKTVYTKIIIEDLIEEINSKKIIYISCDRHSLKEIKNIVDEFDIEIASKGINELIKHRIVRITNEAFDQGGVLGYSLKRMSLLFLVKVSGRSTEGLRN